MEQQSTAISKKAMWAGYIMSVLPSLLMIFSAVMKLAKPPAVVKGFADYGFSENLIVPIGILELLCTVTYLIPRTAVLGAILLSAYIGGAVCTNLRVGKDVIMPAIVGVLFWGGLFMRDHRIRDLIPLKR